MDPLPWDHVDTGVTRGFLLAERERALAGELDAGLRGRAVLARAASAATEIAVVTAGRRADEPRLPTGGRRFRKSGRLRFLSHLELARALERSVRRAGLPYAVTQGSAPT